MSNWSITLDSQLHFPSRCPSGEFILKNLTYDNPDYETAKRYSKYPGALDNIDPHIRYYTEDYLNQQITAPVGVQDMLFPICRGCVYQCQVLDNRTKGQRPEEKRDFIVPITPRPSQVRALHAVRNTIGYRGAGLVQMPTGTGKTMLSYLLAQETGLNTLFITHTMDLADQTYYGYERITGKTPGFIGGGMYEIDSHFTVAIINSLYKKQNYEEWNDRFGLIIFDEVHKLPANMCHEVMKNLKAKYKIGLTATLNRGDGLAGAVFNAFGSVVYKVTIPEAIAEGSLVPIDEMELIYTNYRSDYDSEKIERRASLFKVAANEASLDMDRNRMIQRKVEEEAGNGKYTILVLNSLEQCQILSDLLAVCPSVKSAIFTGDLSAKQRLTIVNSMKDGEINALLTVKLAGIGLDIPRADVLLMDQKISDPLNIEQIVGRVVRACPTTGKTSAKIIDVYDQHVDPFANQTRARGRVYNKFKIH